eukprot:CAMPEP_0204446630 /NCGR_PEP_ID=MMETSP0470-20130426/95026_1 /ASSEMBLY_ACC=CAM_ASM_000385 /TAXON_ID=2969 /ORGANISM="Oxyrrhis marina" /LENGTH=147 /DNA_ID=CAMNT_0051446229 /DNA_START=203 /DNA_END=647 /DNA_ORIENTATION=-
MCTPLRQYSASWASAKVSVRASFSMVRVRSAAVALTCTTAPTRVEPWKTGLLARCSNDAHVIVAFFLSKDTHTGITLSLASLVIALDPLTKLGHTSRWNSAFSAISNVQAAQADRQQQHGTPTTVPPNASSRDVDCTPGMNTGVATG